MSVVSARIKARVVLLRASNMGDAMYGPMPIRPICAPQMRPDDPCLKPIEKPAYPGATAQICGLQRDRHLRLESVGHMRHAFEGEAHVWFHWGDVLEETAMFQKAGEL